MTVTGMLLLYTALFCCTLCTDVSPSPEWRRIRMFDALILCTYPFVLQRHNKRGQMRQKHDSIPSSLSFLGLTTTKLGCSKPYLLYGITIAHSRTKNMFEVTNECRCRSLSDISVIEGTCAVTVCNQPRESAVYIELYTYGYPIKLTFYRYCTWYQFSRLFLCSYRCV